jgi:hypothetical protein
MTTDLDLRSALEQDAGSAGGRSGWDDVVRRGRRRQRVQRARVGALAAVAAVAVVGAISLTRHDPDPTVTVNDPQPTTTSAPTTTSSTLEDEGLPLTGPELRGARVQGAFLTVITAPSDPPRGFDPCTARHPRVVESPEQVGVELVDASIERGHAWAACQASPFSGWGRIELTEPLGDRTLVDLTTGNEIHVVDSATILFPTTIPQPMDLEEWDEFAGPGAGTTEAMWSFGFEANDLFLNVTTDDAGGCEGGRDVSVRGSTGVLCEARNASTLEFHENGHSYVLELGVTDGRQASPYTSADLIAVAEGLEPLGG